MGAEKRDSSERSYSSSRNYLAHESFNKQDYHEVETEDGKSYTLIASTLHPKKVLKDEMKKEKRKEEERLKFEEEKRKLEEELRGMKRKGREWELKEKLKQEKSERKKKDKE